MNISMNNGRISVNGKNYTGNNVSVVNNRVIIDGVEQDGKLLNNIDVVVHGDVNVIEDVTGTVTANNVGDITTGTGDINCNDVTGSIKTGTGDVHCGNVGGNVKTGNGDIIHR